MFLWIYPFLRESPRVAGSLLSQRTRRFYLPDICPEMGRQPFAPPRKKKPKAAHAQLIRFPLTAGRAKKEMANTEKQEAMVFPIHVCGTKSPYPMVVTVTFEKNTRMEIMPAGWKGGTARESAEETFWWRGSWCRLSGHFLSLLKWIWQ